MESKIETRGLHLSWNGKKVLSNINVQFPNNKVTALIGPSGCGKTTLLKSINRMHDGSPGLSIEGEILLEGKNIYAKDADVVGIRRKVGMVFQKPNPFPKSIYDNVVYGLRIGGENNKKKLDEVAEESLRHSALWDEVHNRLNTLALELSGGQQQRLCIARTIAVSPEVILMDEPCSALDPISTEKVERLILKLKEQYTIIIVTHNMQQAQRVADFTGFMYLGEMIEFGPTTDIFNNPKETLTANYVSGNFG
ncbi:MAG: phosphate ABC transporter ATP-binding protein PstB [Chitinophagales bacterium]|nr:phosphate ABC transporter ATP-binding protein PstB [Chitinophagales bacterium]